MLQPLTIFVAFAGLDVTGPHTLFILGTPELDTAHQHPQVLGRAALSLFILHPMLILVVVLAQVEDIFKLPHLGPEVYFEWQREELSFQ